jgi:hypothetical protein
MSNPFSRFIRVWVFIFRPLPRVPRLLRLLLFGLTLLGLSITWDDIKPWFDADPMRWLAVVFVLLFVAAFFACMEYQKRLDMLAGVRIKVLERMCSAHLMPELRVHQQREKNALLFTIYAAFRNADTLPARVKFPHTIEAKIRIGRFRYQRVSMKQYGMSSVRRGDPMMFYNFHPELWWDVPAKDEQICHASYWCQPENMELARISHKGSGYRRFRG